MTNQRELAFAPQVVDVSDIAVADAVTLRPYQADAVDWVMAGFAGESDSVLVVLPTGTGKSVVFSEVMRRFSERYTGRILLLAHRRELLTQAIGHSKNAGLAGELEMAGNTAGGKCDVVCASVQTLISKRKCKPCGATGQLNGEGCTYCDGRGKVPRYESFNPKTFGLVVTDEAHHAAAKTYRNVYQWFGQNKGVRHLGVTATPRRGDDVGLSNIYGEAWDHLPLPTAISEGWLVPLRQMFVRCDSLSLTNVRTRAGDFVDGDLEKAFLGGSAEEEKRLLHEVAFPVAEEAKDGRVFIAFAASVAHAEKLTAELNSYPHLADRVECLTGSTSEDERDAIMARLKSGRSVGLVNCGVCTEGFDLPQISIVAIARPTKSEGLYLQMIGRGTRPLKGVVDGPVTAESRRAAIAGSAKPHCVVMDFVGAAGSLKQQSVGSVLSGLPLDDEDLIAAMNAALKAETAADMERLIQETKEERLAKLEEKARKMREAAERKASERIKASGVYAESGEYTKDTVPLFGKAFNAFRDYTPEPDMATQKQVNLLVKVYGVDPNTATRYTKRQAGSIIDQYQKRAKEGAPMPGLYRNKYPGRCVVTGKPVGKEEGWARKNSYGKWETLSHAGAMQLADNYRQQHGSPQPAMAGVDEEVPF